MKIVEPVCDVLRLAGTPWALIGGHAVGARGFPRMTVDYDFLTTDRRVLDTEVWQALETTGAAIDIRHGDADDPLAGVVRITMPGGVEADVVVGRWSWQEDLLRRAEVLDIGDVRVPVPRTSDLILLKLAAGGALDLQDVIVLLGISDADVAREVDARIHAVGPQAVAAWRRVRPG